jgi:hypothetical protein
MQGSLRVAVAPSPAACVAVLSALGAAGEWHVYSPNPHPNPHSHPSWVRVRVRVRTLALTL